MVSELERHRRNMERAACEVSDYTAYTAVQSQEQTRILAQESQRHAVHEQRMRQIAEEQARAVALQAERQAEAARQAAQAAEQQLQVNLQMKADQERAIEEQKRIAVAQGFAMWRQTADGRAFDAWTTDAAALIQRMRRYDDEIDAAMDEDCAEAQRLYPTEDIQEPTPVRYNPPVKPQPPLFAPGPLVKGALHDIGSVVRQPVCGFVLLCANAIVSLIGHGSLPWGWGWGHGLLSILLWAVISLVEVGIVIGAASMIKTFFDNASGARRHRAAMERYEKDKAVYAVELPEYQREYEAAAAHYATEKASYDQAAARNASATAKQADYLKHMDVTVYPLWMRPFPFIYEDVYGTADVQEQLDAYVEWAKENLPTPDTLPPLDFPAILDEVAAGPRVQQLLSRWRAERAGLLLGPSRAATVDISSCPDSALN